jgi:hypothetical protein
MIWFLENILIPIIISLVFMWYGRIYIKRINSYNSFKIYIEKIKILLILPTCDNFNENKEAEITLVIDNLSLKLNLKNKKLHNNVQEKLDIIRRGLPDLSKNINESLFQQKSALMVETLNDIIKDKDIKHKHF